MRIDFKSSIYSHPEYRKKREKGPFLSIAEELLQCLKEDLISELIVISSYREATPGNKSGANVGYTSVKRKKDRFDQTFGKFPQCELELTGVSKQDGVMRPYRWERTKQICPDFDIFIDDSLTIMKENLANLPAEKIYVMPDYKYARELRAPNLYHLKTTMSDLKDQDFAVAALEIQTKKLEKEIDTTKAERERERESNLLNDGGWGSDCCFSSFVGDGLQKEKK